MEKLIKEEINRIREVMGLKLLKESIVPTGVIKSLLSDFATVVGKNLDDITQMTNIGTRRTSVAGLYNNLKNSTDQSVKNFVDSVDEVASFYKRDVVALLDDISTGKVADEIQDEIFTKLASKTTGVDAKLVDLLPDDVASYYKQASNSYTRFENNLDGLINAYEKDPDALQRAIDKNVEIRNAIVDLPDGPFKQKLLSDWDNQLKFFDDNVVNKVRGGADEAAALSDDTPIIELKIEDAPTPEEINTQALTAEEIVNSDLKVANIIDESGNIKSRAAGIQKANETFERLKNTPDSKWSQEDIALIEQLNKLGLLTAEQNQVLKSQLVTVNELIELYKNYETYKSSFKGRQTPATFVKWLNDNGYKYPSWLKRTGAKTLMYFEKLGETYKQLLKVDEIATPKWWKAATTVMLQAAVVLGGAFTAFWRFTRKGSEKFAGYLDSLVDLSPEQRQQAIDEFFQYDTPEINGFNIYSSDDNGIFNSQYRNSPPRIDKVVNPKEGTLTLRTYVMVNGDYCRAFKLSVSEFPLAGGENFKPHKLETFGQCDKTPKPEFMPGSSTPPAPAPAPTTTTTPTLNDFIKFIKSNDGWGKDAPQDDNAYEEIGTGKFRVIFTDGNYDYKANADGTFTYIE